jgi:fatty acid-binding protein DegV
MQQVTDYNTGDDALDVNTNVAVDFVRKHKSQLDAARWSELAARRSPEAQRTLIVVDTACDLPHAWLDHHGVVLMPRIIRFGERQVTETRDRDASLAAVKQLTTGEFVRVQSLPLSPVVMRDEMQRHMIESTEAVLHICSSASRSKHFVNALSATQSLVLIHNKVRRTLGKPSSLTAWVIDSTNAFGGVGVLLAYAVQQRDKGALAANVAVSLNAFRSHVHTLVAPHDMAFIARTAQTIEGESIARWKLTAATLFDLKPIVHINADRVGAIARVRGHDNAVGNVLQRVTDLVARAALLSPFVALSYAGRLDEIEALADYRALRALCSRYQITLSISVMSITGAIMLGPRALSVSFASQQFRA